MRFSLPLPNYPNTIANTMVLDSKNMLSALKKIVVPANKNNINKNNAKQENETRTVRLNIEEQEDEMEGTELVLANQYSLQPKMVAQNKMVAQTKMAARKRVVSECASIIADPTQAAGQPPGCFRWRTWLPTVLRVPCLLVCLYLFICSLDILATSFRLMAGKAAGSIFRENPLLMNPVVGLMMGVLFTVLVQSSSTCTSVIVSMVSSGVLTVEGAIPMIMGANIGTSLTNTLVSFSQLTDRDQFERAFAGATVHDCFNWLTVFVLLSLEVCTGYLFKLTGWLTEHLETVGSEDSYSIGSVNLLGTITKPLTDRVVQIQKAVLKCWALGGCQDDRLLKIWCDNEVKSGEFPSLINATNLVNESKERCVFLLNLEGLSDLYLGLILFLVALLCLSTCLIFIVKLLHSLLQGTVADLAKKTINSEVPGLPWLSGYIAILAGAVLTFLVQSSSVFTSTITPLVGIGLISVDRMYPLTLGSNIGTTTTALLASLSADPTMLRSSLQIALCHLTFNIHGIMLFYPIPAMRWPLGMCKVLGRTTAKYRWFALVYLALMFLIFPGLVICLSIAGSTVLLCFLIPFFILVIFVVVVNVLQDSSAHLLPSLLTSWTFLPEWMRSLDPMDRIISRYGCLREYAEIPGPDPPQIVTQIK